MKLIRNLDPSRFQQTICTLRGVAPHVCSWGSDVVVRHAGGPGDNFQFNVFRLRRLMSEIRPTIVHSRNWGGIEAILAARLASVPVIIHSEHGYDLGMLSGLPLRQSVYRHLCYRLATTIFTVTEELRSYHATQARWKSSGIRVLRNGVDTETFKPRPELRITIRQQVGIPSGSVVIGFVGRMIALKDVLTLLKATDSIVGEIPHLHLLLIGAGPQLAFLQEYVCGSPLLCDRVTFLGNRSDIAHLLNAMDIFVLPSLVEGMSNTLLEALASGLPALATNVGGNPEIIQDGTCGYLFYPGDVTGLADRLRVLLHDRSLRTRLGTVARQTAVKEFSMDTMLNCYSELYISLARERGVVLPGERHVRD